MYDFTAPLWMWDGDAAWQRAAYVLPIKKQVRVREGLSSGDQVEVRLALLEG